MALAIALGRDPPHHDDPPEGPDSFLADHGFEYIDGERTHHPEIPSVSVSEENDPGGGVDDDDDDDGVQGLPRVIDALSTIMWPTMVRERDNGGDGKRKSQLRPSLFDIDDILHGEDGELEADEEETLAALMAADATDHGAPQTRASRMQGEMQALERWLVENEEMHEAEFGGAGIDDGDDDAEAADEDEGVEDEDEDDRDEEKDCGDALRSLQAPLPDTRAPSADDPWAASSAASNPTASAARPSIATPSSGFDDDFSTFVSAPPAASSTSASASGLASTSASGSMIAHPRLHIFSQTLLKPSHTGGSFRSLRSGGVSDVEIGSDAGYEALDDRSSANFSPEHEHGPTRVFDDDDVDPRTATGQRFGGKAPDLGDIPFDLTNILDTLQTMREDMAGIEDEKERRATTARFTSEFVFKRMGVDGDEGDEIEG